MLVGMLEVGFLQIRLRKVHPGSLRRHEYLPGGLRSHRLEELIVDALALGGVDTPLDGALTDADLTFTIQPNDSCLATPARTSETSFISLFIGSSIRNAVMSDGCAQSQENSRQGSGISSREAVIPPTATAANCAIMREMPLWETTVPPSEPFVLV